MNKYQNYYENELEDDELDDSPYDEIHPRPHLESEEVEVDVNPRSKAVYEQISAKYRPQDEAPALVAQDYADEPLYQEYEKDRDQLRELRDEKADADFITNLSRAASHAARGPLTPLSPEPLYEGIARSNEQGLKSAEGEIDRKNKVIQAIENRRSRERVAEKVLKSRIEKENKNKSDKEHRLLNQDIRAVEGIFRNPAITKEVVKMNAARNVGALIDEIEKGKLKGSKNISKQLTNLIATIELGSPGGVADRQSMGVETLYTTAKGALGFLSSRPTETIPKSYLNQLKTEGQALGNRAVKNFEVLTDSALAGTEGKISELGKKRQQEMLRQNPIFSQPESISEIQQVETVRIRKPNGKPTTIPKSELEDALRDGATLL